MKKSVWTIILIVFLALSAFFTGIGLIPIDYFSDMAVTGTAASVYGLLFFIALAGVAWMQTRGGALLIVIVGLLWFVAEFISSALVIYPQYGDQLGQILYSLLTLILPVFGFLSYRSIKG